MSESTATPTATPTATNSSEKFDFDNLKSTAGIMAYAQTLLTSLKNFKLNDLTKMYNNYSKRELVIMLSKAPLVTLFCFFSWSYYVLFTSLLLLDNCVRVLKNMKEASESSKLDNCVRVLKNMKPASESSKTANVDPVHRIILFVPWVPLSYLLNYSLVSKFAGLIMTLVLFVQNEETSSITSSFVVEKLSVLVSYCYELIEKNLDEKYGKYIFGEDYKQKSD